MFVRYESLNQFMRLYPIVTGIVIIHIVLYILTELLAITELKGLLVGSNLHIALNGEYWRLITPIFVHLSLPHVLFNTFSLILFGPPLERILGKTKFILTYLLMGIVGNVATLYLDELLLVHAGASGAIYGIFGLYMYMIFMRKELIDPQSRQIIIVILIIGVFMTFLRTNVNLYAHLFGFFAGLALGPIVLNRIKKIFY